MSENTLTGNGSLLPELGMLADPSRLPSMSSVVTEVLQITSSTSTSATDLARVIGKDPALAARTLRLANSGYFALPSKIATIQQAVVMLGMDMIRACTLGAAVTQALRPARLVTGFSLEGFWHHSASVANAAEDIARGTISSYRQEAFAAGLLHDIGSLVFACHVPDLYARVLTEGRQGNRPLREVERRLFGVDHADIGAAVTRAWGFPGELVETIAHHHSLGDAPAPYAGLAAAVHIADAVAHGTGSPGCETAHTPRADSKAWALLGGLAMGMHPGEAQRSAQKLQQRSESVDKFTRALLVA